VVVEGLEVVLERDLLHQRRGLAGAPVDAPAGQDVEGRDPLGDADGVVVAVGEQRHAVADPDPLGAGGDEGEEHLRRRRVRVLVEPVVLDLPHRVVAELVGEDDLLHAVVEQLRLGRAGRRGDLHLVEE